LLGYRGIGLIDGSHSFAGDGHKFLGDSAGDEMPGWFSITSLR
jgi:hypothetical protein